MAQPSGLFSSLTKTQPLLAEQSQDYQEALQELKASLDARKNQMFDPVMLAMAQGFLAPTKSGGFGESLGNAAGMAAPAIEKQQKGEMENAQMRLQLAQMERAQAQKQKAALGFGQIVTGESPNTAGAPAGSPSGGSAGTPAVRDITMNDALKYAQAYPEEKEYIKLLTEAAKMGSDRFKIAMNGTVFDTQTRSYVNVDIPGQKQEAYSTPFGTYQMTPNEYTRFNMANNQGLGQTWMDAFRKGATTGIDQAIADKMEGKTPKIELPTTAENKATGRKTVSEQEAAAKSASTEAEINARSRAQQTSDVRESAKAASTLIPLYDRAGKLLKTKGIETALGVFENPDFLAQLGTLADEGVRVGPYAINAPGVRKIAMNFSQDPAVINAITELGQVEAMWQFAQRKGLGSGTSVSNMEQQLVNAMGPNFKDPKDAYTKKLEFMREKANFEQKLAKELRRTNMQYEDYADTDDFDKLFTDYRTRLENIGQVKLPSTKPSGTVNPNAAADLRSKLKL